MVVCMCVCVLFKAFEFYDVVMDGIDKVLALANEQDLKEAERIGAKVQLPPFLFKDFSGDFYRYGREVATLLAFVIGGGRN